MGFADDNFSKLCPDVSSYKVWCLSPPADGVCCGICPNGGVSGWLNMLSIGFNTLSSIAAIALSPESAPSSLLINLLQCNAYAIALVGTALTGTGALDFFHAGYALLTALSCVIPLTAIALSPSWAVTGEEAPEVKRQRLEIIAASVVRKLKQRINDAERESSDSYDSDSGSSDEDDDERGERRDEKARQKRKALRRLKRMLRSNPGAFVSVSNGSIPCSHITLYIGFAFSVTFWLAGWWIAVRGGLTNEAAIKLSQPNCTAKLSGASMLAYADAAFLFIAVMVFFVTIARLLLRDCATVFNSRFDDHEIARSPRLVFFVSFLVWIVWMSTAAWLYWEASTSILLMNGEMNMSFGTVFSFVMTLVPITNALRSLNSHR